MERTCATAERPGFWCLRFWLPSGQFDLNLFSMNETAIPVAGPALTGAELAERWEKMDKLPPDEANASADDLEAARRHLPPLKSAGD